MTRTTTAVASLLTASLLLAAACGDDEDAAVQTETADPTITEELTEQTEIEMTEEEIQACIERTTEDANVSDEEARELCTQGLVEPFEDSDAAEQGANPEAGEDGGSGGASP